MKTIAAYAVACSALSALACSSTNDDQTGGPSLASTSSTDNTATSPLANVQPEKVGVEVLNEFDAGTDHLTFLRAGRAEDTQDLMIQFSRPAGYAKGTLDLLLEKAEEQNLTFLETFQALAPADLEPHPALVEAHLAQGKARGDTAVRRVDFDVDQRIDKSIAGCDAYLQFNIEQQNAHVEAGNISVRNNWFGPVILCPSTNFNQDCFKQVSGAVFVNSCIENAELQSVSPWWRIGGDNWKTFDVPASQLGPDRKIGWLIPANLPPRGDELFGPKKTIAIETFNGTGYHLRAARSAN